MADFESLKRDLLAECEDDFVGLWSIIGYVEDEMPGADEAAIRETTVAMVHDMLTQGLIEAGFPDSDGRTFHPWPFSPDVVTDKIRSLWKLNAARPKPGEVVWFTTPSGTSVAARA